MASFRNLFLYLKEFPIVDPDTRHLVHEDKGSLKCIVDSLIRWISYALVLNSISTLAKVHVP
jgi:hypothetical protein